MYKYKYKTIQTQKPIQIQIQNNNQAKSLPKIKTLALMIAANTIGNSSELVLLLNLTADIICTNTNTK